MRCPREKFLQDIEAVFQKAFETGNYQAALKAKEVLGREQGILGSQKKKSSIKQDISSADNFLGDFDLKSLDSLSDAALEQLVNSLLRLKANPDPKRGLLRVGEIIREKGARNFLGFLREWRG